MVDWYVLELESLCQLFRQLTNVGQTYGMLSSGGFSGVDVLLISFWLHGVENPRFVAGHFQDVVRTYPPSLIPNFLLFARVSPPHSVCVLTSGLIPSYNTGLCVLLCDRPSSSFTHGVSHVTRP